MYIVIIDTRENNGKVLALTDDDDNIKLFTTKKELFDVLPNLPIAKAFPLHIVDLDKDEK